MKNDAENQTKGKIPTPDRMSRRKLLTTMGITGAAVVATGSLMPTFGQTALAQTSARNDDKSERFFDDASRLTYRYKEKSPERSVGEKLRETFSVLDFGAVGDGEASDSKAIQAALDAATKTERGAIVEIPDGSYRITEHLSIYSNTTLLASPNAYIYRDHGGYLLMNGDRDEAYYDYDGHGNIQIVGGIWDQNAENYGQAICIAIGHGDQIIIDNITVLDVPGSHAIEINSSQNVSITNSRFLGFTDPNGDRGFSEAIQLDLARESGVFPPFGAYDKTPCRKITITHCYFGKSEKSGSWGRGIGSHSSTIERWHEDITITHNIFEDMENQAVRTYSWRNVIISNNTFLHCGGAIGVYPPLLSKPQDTKDPDGKQTNKSQACEQYVISNNTIWGGQTYSPGVSISGQDEGGFIMHASVTGNTISNSEGDSQAIYVNNAKRINITGNTISGINSNGISGSNGEQYKIEGNVIYDTKSNGIRVQNFVQQAVVANNEIKDVDLHGIYVTNKIDMINIAHNNILNVNREASDDGQHIRITEDNDHISIMGNICKQEDGSAVALKITESNKNIVRTGNVFTDLTIDDTSDSKVGVDLE